MQRAGLLLLSVLWEELSEEPEFSLPALLNEDDPVDAQCTAPGRCKGTGPNFIWTGTLNTDNSSSKHSFLNKDESVTYTSRITFTPSIDDQNKTLTCVVYFPAVGISTQKTVALKVKGRPEPIGQWPEFGDWLKSNCKEKRKRIICTCWIQSMPPPVVLWQINKEIVTGNYSNRTMELLSAAYGHRAKSTLILREVQGDPKSTIKIQCLNANKQGSPKKTVAKQRDFGIVSWSIIGTVIIVFFTALFFFYFGKKVQTMANDRSSTDTAIEEELDTTITTSSSSPSTSSSPSSSPPEEPVPRGKG
ncbi:uncharacterized protein LOC115076251 isoform X2 [Rhinatrema bivittatum]|uniref:uncharacterized protein LOC115076251 isoform X2 n=1 Tax=Rhinatrema bivittatum TaxID=194408 RepID=UPI00112AB829|nr:uncharacterized protein LOC115076251 isoform X2 [Rhinatrema bivittatum]